MSVNVRTVGFDSNDLSNIPAIKRPVTVLSDGSRAMLVIDRNQSGVSGDGGDNTGVTKFYIYRSTDGTSWTLTNTITPTNAPRTAGSDGISAAFCSGRANDNLHISFIASDGSIRYYRLTGTPGSWTAGSQELAYGTPTETQGFRRLDMDIINQATGTYTGDCVMIGAYYSDLTSPYYLSFATATRRLDTGAWVAAVPVVVSSTNGNYPNFWDITLACSAKGADGTTRIGAALAVFSVPFRYPSGGDVGDRVIALGVNADTGAMQNNVSIDSDLNVGLGGWHRHYWIFSTSTTADEFTILGLVGVTGIQAFAQRIRITSLSGGGSVGHTIDIPASLSPSLGDAADIGSYGIRGFSRSAYWSREGGGVLFHLSDGTVKNAVIRMSRATNTVTFASAANTIDDAKKVSGSGVEFIWAGCNRNFDQDIIPMAEWFGRPTLRWQLHYHEIKAPLAPATLIPAAGSSLVTDVPTIKADHRMPLDTPEYMAKVVWQIAKNSGFTTSLKTVTQADSSFVLPVGTKTLGGKVTATAVVPSSTPLDQSTWYIRAAAIDEYGRQGPWSSHQSFVIAHPPSATNLEPSANDFLRFTSTTRFTWTFSDPSPTDYQTAYEIEVERVDTGATVFDTGKITSSNKYANLALDSALKDIQLRWKIRLWDRDNVAGAFSTPVAFTIGDPPTVAITAPTEGATITTASPVVTFDVTELGLRVAEIGTITLSQGGVPVWYDIINEAEIAARAKTIPAGFLVNNQTYSVTVAIFDSAGLTGSDVNAFLTAWVPPAAPAFTVTPSYHEAAGFIRVQWTDSTMDPDFSSYRVYRREVGEAWELLNEQTSILASYTFDDWMAGSEVEYEYAVVQVINYFGSIVESVPVPTYAVGHSTDYWLIHPTDNTKNLRIEHVTSDSFSDEYEQESYVVIGRGRHVDYGEHLGYIGSLSASLRDVPDGMTARQQKKALEEIKAERTYLFLRNPFGDVWKVATGNLGISRIAGVGTREQCDLDIPYQEVSF